MSNLVIKLGFIFNLIPSLFGMTDSKLAPINATSFVKINATIWIKIH